MSDGLLESIIQLEKWIQAQVVAEQERAATWQERELVALEASQSKLRQQVEDRFHQELIKRQKSFQHQGETLEAEASGWCQRLAALDDATLCEILRRHLAALLPGGDNDHPHVQN